MGAGNSTQKESHYDPVVVIMKLDDLIENYVHVKLIVMDVTMKAKLKAYTREKEWLEQKAAMTPIDFQNQKILVRSHLPPFSLQCKHEMQMILIHLMKNPRQKTQRE